MEKPFGWADESAEEKVSTVILQLLAFRIISGDYWVGDKSFLLWSKVCACSTGMGSVEALTKALIKCFWDETCRRGDGRHRRVEIRENFSWWGCRWLIKSSLVEAEKEEKRARLKLKITSNSPFNAKNHEIAFASPNLSASTLLAVYWLLAVSEFCFRLKKPRESAPRSFFH